MANLVKKVHLFSVGGCGTRMLHRWLDHYFTTNEQSAVHKMELPDSLPEDEAIIYLYGPPMASVLSFYGKHYDGDTDFLRLHCHNLGVPPVPNDIHKFIENGVDGFEIYNHRLKFANFYSSAILDRTNYRGPMIVVDYNDLWRNNRWLINSLRLDPFTPFPEKKNRSIKNWVTIDIQKGLQEIYYE